MKIHKVKNNTIFISIASYRDPELIPTILDCVKKAEYPKKLFFGICLQDTNQNLRHLKHIAKKYNINMRIVFCDWRDSQGACWARHIIQKKLYNNQTFYLQLDSHHRFVEQWDSLLVYMTNKLKNKGIDKPIIGGYCPGYNVQFNHCDPAPIQISSFDTFTNDGDLVFRPQVINNSHNLLNLQEEVIPARFLSGHFIFADGVFCKECLYDPNLYFRGEEISLSARAYTSGYDFYHPVIPIIWHFYLRPSEHKHWDNHQNGNGFVISAEDRSVKAKERVRKLLGIEPNNINFGQYCLGKNRHLHEYELYAGVDFKNKNIHKYAANPRNDAPFAYKMTEEEWSKHMMIKKLVVVKLNENIIKNLNKELEFLAMCIENSSNKLLHRYDIKPDELVHIMKSEMTWKKAIGVEDLPARAVLIPFYKNKGFGDRIIINTIDYYDTTI